MAVRVGFEPTEPAKAQRFSRPPDSTTLAPHRTSIITDGHSQTLTRSGQAVRGRKRIGIGIFPARGGLDIANTTSYVARPQPMNPVSRGLPATRGPADRAVPQYDDR